MNSGQDNPPKHKSTKPSGIGWKYFSPHILTRTILIFLRLQKKEKKKKLDSVTRHCELTKRASANGDYDSALYIGAVPKRDVTLNCVHKEIFHDVFSSSIHSSRVDETRRQSEETKERREVISSLFHSFYFRSWRGKGTGRRSDRWCFKSLKTQRSLNQFEHSHRFFSCFVYFLFWETEFISKHGKIFTFIL